MIGIAQPSFSERILRRLLASAPYIAVRRAWFERSGGFDPELGSESALNDFFKRLRACPTRLKNYSAPLLSQVNTSDNAALLGAPSTTYAPPL